MFRHLIIGLVGGFFVSVHALADNPERPSDAIDALIQGNQIPDAISLARKLGEAGDVESQFRLGLLYWHGVGATQNYNEALKWVTLAALSNQQRAIIARKLILSSVDQSALPKILDWCRAHLQKSAEAGDDTDLIALSRSYTLDFGFENEIEAYYWAMLAVAVGQTDAREQRDGFRKKLGVVELAKAQDKAALWLEKWRGIKVR